MKTSLAFWRGFALAFAGSACLAVGGAAGTAFAISPIISPAIKWGGGWEARVYNATGALEVAIVPAGRSLMVTDILASNFTNQPTQFFLLQGSANCQNSLTDRLSGVVVAPYGTVHLPLETGVGFPAGQRVCVSTGGTLNFNFRGFFFTPAPAS